VSPARKGQTGQDTVWVEDLGWPKELNHVFDEGPDAPMGSSNFKGEKGLPVVKYTKPLP